jgi:D-alanine-D-alanine ligase
MAPVVQPVSPTKEAPPKVKEKRAAKATKPRSPRPKVDIAIDKEALKKVHLVAVAYSHVEREFFPTDEAYEAELEVENRAQEVVASLEKLGIPAKAYPGDQYFFTNLLVDHPDLVLNLVDTLRGKDSLQTSVPAALELANIPYTGAGMQGLVIGNDRNLVKQLLVANNIPTPEYQFIRRRGTGIDEALGVPLIVKLNESGGSVGIDNHAVKETVEDAAEKVNEMIGDYHLPVVVERFIDGDEITVVVFDDGTKKHVFLGQKIFGIKPDGKHAFTSLESYRSKRAYRYKAVADADLAETIQRFASRAFDVLRFKDYGKFDIRVDEQSRIPYFTDANPNTAFGPSIGLPMTEVLDHIYHVPFDTILASMISKYARKLGTP